MLFNSLQYIIFLPLVVIAYYLLPHRFRWILLLAASYYFYMVWRVEYIALIILSTLVDYFASIMMERQSEKKKRRVFLFLSLFVNLGLLFVFKYFNFFNAQFGRIYSIAGLGDYPFAELNMLLPMGISFYTFQTLSYTIDVYRGNRKAEKHLGYFALYVTYFPQLVAGPIERSDRLLPQLREKHKPSYKRTMSAILKICWGMFKKIMIADRAAVLVDKVYGNIGEYSGIYLIIATLGFAIQIYCDFSAYSDIAIGSARLMGVELMENFKLPYFAKSISDFWSRWHISLSSWFKDYLYIPLGGNRVSKIRYYINLMIVFVVSGFWHGANWTFIAWGMLHGGYQVIERVIGDLCRKWRLKIHLPLLIKQLLTFALVLIGWVFFRLDSMRYAGEFFMNIFPLNIASFGDKILSLGLDMHDIWALVIVVVILYLVEALKYYKNKDVKMYSPFVKGLLSILLIIVTYVFGFYGEYDTAQFIYFQF